MSKCTACLREQQRMEELASLHFYSTRLQLALEICSNLRPKDSLNEAMPDRTLYERCSGTDSRVFPRPVRLKKDKECKHRFFGETCVEALFPNKGKTSVWLEKHHLLHSFKGTTADVAGDHRQGARMKAGQHHDQIALEPQLVLFITKAWKFFSKRC